MVALHEKENERNTCASIRALGKSTLVLSFHLKLFNHLNLTIYRNSFRSGLLIWHGISFLPPGRKASSASSLSCLWKQDLYSHPTLFLDRLVEHLYLLLFLPARKAKASEPYTLGYKRGKTVWTVEKVQFTFPLIDLSNPVAVVLVYSVSFPSAFEYTRVEVSQVCRLTQQKHLEQRWIPNFWMWLCVGNLFWRHLHAINDIRAGIEADLNENPILRPSSSN